jgi:hypothetical protein
MPATTAKGYPYPLGTDPVSDGDDAIKNLAEATDAKTGVCATGNVTINTPTTGTPASAAITFPAGRFTVAPIVVCSLRDPSANAPQNFSQPASAVVSTTGATIWVCRIAGAAANCNVYWHAIQV